MYKVSAQIPTNQDERNICVYPSTAYPSDHHHNDSMATNPFEHMHIRLHVAGIQESNSFIFIMLVTLVITWAFFGFLNASNM